MREVIDTTDYQLFCHNEITTMVHKFATQTDQGLSVCHTAKLYHFKGGPFMFFAVWLINIDSTSSIKTCQNYMIHKDSDMWYML